MEDADEICDDTEEEVVTKPTASDVRSALEVLQNLSFLAQKQEQKGLLLSFESLHTSYQLATQKQSSISDYFTRK